MTGALIAISIVLVVTSGTAAIAVAYLRLRRHRADAVAMAGYRKLAGQAVAGQERTGDEIARLAADVR
ncbi:MAG: hypothetical protein ACRDNT_22760 [Streptosporangiaceae bacterium]